MIIETPYKTGDTITIKTTAGEELVARMIEEDNSTVTVKKPMALLASQQGVGLGPWTITINPEASIKINKHSCIVIHKTDEEMAKQYIENTSGLQL